VSALAALRGVLVVVAAGVWAVPSAGSPASQIVIEAEALVPPLLTTTVDQTVVFVNRSGRVVHIDFLGDAGEHHVFQVPGRIRATFHRPGRHPYVVHFETHPRGELTGAVEVVEAARPLEEPRICSGITIEEMCIER
jgi:hypothetical protein